MISMAFIRNAVLEELLGFRQQGSFAVSDYLVGWALDRLGGGRAPGGGN
jgi:hypothetical protein